MTKYEIELEDFKKFEDMFKVATSIKTLYQKLYDLEISNQKETEEYKKLLDYLNIAIEVEDNIYKDTQLDYLKCESFIDMIISDRVAEGFTQHLESVASQEYNNRLVRRILTRLETIRMFDPEFYEAEIPEEVQYIMRMFGITDMEKQKKKKTESNKKDAQMQVAFDKDFINAYLYFLQKFTSKKEYKRYEKNLIAAKYYLSYLYKHIENRMIEKDFNVPDDLYLNSWVRAELLKMDEYEHNSRRELYGMDMLESQIYKLLDIGDKDYSDDSKAITSILRQCLLRAALLFMTDETISEINYEFHKLIEDDPEYLEEHKDDKISPQLIANCFRYVNDDRKKAEIITLNYKPN